MYFMEAIFQLDLFPQRDDKMSLKVSIVVDKIYNKSNVIEYITISTTGNASDFGDLLGSYETGGAASGSAS